MLSGQQGNAGRRIVSWAGASAPGATLQAGTAALSAHPGIWGSALSFGALGYKPASFQPALLSFSSSALTGHRAASKPLVPLPAGWMGCIPCSANPACPWFLPHHSETHPPCPGWKIHQNFEFLEISPCCCPGIASRWWQGLKGGFPTSSLPTDDGHFWDDDGDPRGAAQGAQHQSLASSHQSMGWYIQNRSLFNPTLSPCPLSLSSPC